MITPRSKAERHYSSRIIVAVVAGIPFALSGCASPGTPRPPSLNLPEPATSLTAERVGNQVHLRWIVSGKTTDALDQRRSISASVCRRLVSSKLAETPCVPILRLPVAQGPSEAVDTLSPSLSTGAPSLLEYRVEVLNARGRSAGMSAAAFTASGTAPPEIEQMQATAAAEGALLTWKSGDANSQVEVRRVSTQVPRQAAPATLKANEEPSEVTLEVPHGQGALDRSARMGSRYTYTAQCVRRVIVDGHALELRSPVSAPVSVEMRDVFPPQPPTGLEAVSGDRGVDLSWRMNTEADLAGYLVFRGETGSPVQLTAAPIAEPVYRDSDVPPGHVFSYTIVAIDRAGNRSAASDPVQVRLRPFVP